MVLVGNKVDLEGSRAVSQEEARELAISFGCAWMLSAWPRSMLGPGTMRPANAVLARKSAIVAAVLLPDF